MRLSLIPSSLLLPLQWGSAVWFQGVAADLPNPCNNPGFRTPVYKISNFTLAVDYIRDIPKFDVRDEANNYSTQCNWVADPNNYQIDPKPDEYAVYCDPRILQGYPAASGWYDVVRNSLNVSQWWVCDAHDGSYPTRIEAFATIQFPKPLSCPNCTIATTRRRESCPLQTCSIADLDIPTAVATLKYPPKPSGPDGVSRTPPGTGSDQPSSVPDNDTPCIGTSFSYPNWDVTDLESLSAQSTLTFNLRNHALDASIRCSTHDSGEVSCDDGSATKTKGTFNAESAELFIEQTWTCSVPGEARGFIFAASGKRVLTTANHGIQIIQGTLTEPLNFKPNVYISAAQSPDCRKLSEEGPSFDILARTQQLSAGTITTIGHWGDIVFDLTNNANGLSMHCEVKRAPDLNNCTTVTELKWYDCYPPDSDQFGREQGPITRFTYNVTSMEIVINQTWYCNEDETHPARFNTVTRPRALPLRTRKVSLASSDSEGMRCSLPSLWRYNNMIYVYGEMDRPFTIPAVPKESVSSTALPPYSISERKPTGHSCTIASAIAPRLEVGTLSFTTGWNSLRPIANGRQYTGVSAAVLLDGIRNSGWPETTWSIRSSGSDSLVPRSDRTDYTHWYPCPNYYSPPMTDCAWTIDFEVGWLAINTSWICNDKDRNKPIAFQSSSSTSFNKTCSYSYDQGNGGSTIDCKTQLASHTLFPQHISNNASAVPA